MSIKTHITGFSLGWLLLVMLPAAVSAPGDIVIPRTADAKKNAMTVERMPESIFPHWIHRLRYRCDACHDDLFEMKLGATEISKALMKKKLSCAICHNGETAFSVGLSTCNRCHAVVEKKKKRKRKRKKKKKRKRKRPKNSRILDAY